MGTCTICRDGLYLRTMLILIFQSLIFLFIGSTFQIIRQTESARCRWSFSLVQAPSTTSQSESSTQHTSTLLHTITAPVNITVYDFHTIRYVAHTQTHTPHLHTHKYTHTISHTETHTHTHTCTYTQLYTISHTDTHPHPPTHTHTPGMMTSTPAHTHTALLDGSFITTGTTNTADISIVSSGASSKKLTYEAAKVL